MAGFPTTDRYAGASAGGIRDYTPGFNVTKSAGTGVPFVDFDSNNPGAQQPGQGYDDTGQAGDRIMPGGDAYSSQVLGTQTQAQTDPYAQWGGQANYNNLVSGFGAQKENIFGTSRDAATNAGIGRQSSILDFIDSLRSGQEGINERGTQNELAKKQGTSSILDMVGRGIRSGGVMLANKNALDSSASQALARAYGALGQRQLGGIGNQYEQENRGIGLAQTDLERQRGTGLRKFEESKNQTVNSIVAEARNSLADLDAAMLDADLPTRVQIEQEKERIKGEAITILSQYDQQLAQGAAGVQPNSVEERRRTAFGLANAGQAATNPFDFSTEVPVQFQGTGPFSTQLPVFTSPRGRREQ